MLVLSIRSIPTLTASILLMAYLGESPVLAQSLSANPPRESAASQSQVISTETDYILGPGDRLHVDIFQVEDYSGDYLVAADGSVNLPLANRIKVGGLTVSEASKLLSQRYGDYLKLPVITVTLLAPRPLKIHVSGEINHPGSYEVNLQTNQPIPSVTDILELAGGITPSADVHRIQVRRSFPQQEQVLIANLADYLQQGNKHQDLILRDGDVVFIPTAEATDMEGFAQVAGANFGVRGNEPINVAVIGEVYRPGTYEVAPESATATYSDPPTVTEAIKLAGGIKPLADVRRIEVRRLTRNGSQRTLPVNLWELLQTGNISKDIILQKGDTIVIPTADTLDPSEASALALASFAPATIRVNVVGEVKQPGGVDVPPNTPLNQAILAAGGFDPERADTESVELIRLNPDGSVSKQEIRVDLARGINEDNNPVLRNNDVVIIKRSGASATSDGLGTIFKPLGYFFPFLRLFN